MTQPYREVVKLGGSLIDYSELIPSLSCWLSSHTESHQVIVVGGGRLADGVRGQFDVGQLSEQEAHYRAVGCMRENTRQIAAWMPEIELESEYGSLLARLERPGVTLFDTQSFLADHEPGLPGTVLPRTWAATSDSIAGRLAITANAGCLTLLKSTLPEQFETIEDLPMLADQEYVDRFLPELKDELPPLRFVNLRDAESLFALRTQRERRVQ